MRLLVRRRYCADANIFVTFLARNFCCCFCCFRVDCRRIMMPTYVPVLCMQQTRAPSNRPTTNPRSRSIFIRFKQMNGERCAACRPMAMEWNEITVHTLILIHRDPVNNSGINFGHNFCVHINFELPPQSWYDACTSFVAESPARIASFACCLCKRLCKRHIFLFSIFFGSYAVTTRNRRSSSRFTFWYFPLHRAGWITIKTLRRWFSLKRPALNLGCSKAHHTHFVLDTRLLCSCVIAKFSMRMSCGGVCFRCDNIGPGFCIFRTIYPNRITTGALAHDLHRNHQQHSLCICVAAKICIHHSFGYSNLIVISSLASAPVLLIFATASYDDVFWALV